MDQATLAQYAAAHSADNARFYNRPEPKAEFAALAPRIAELLRGHKVLVIGPADAGWTAPIAEAAAALRQVDAGPVAPEAAPGEFTAVFVPFWWSHVKRGEQDGFLAQLRAKLGKDTLLVLLDDSYVDGISHPVARTDAEGNTFQFRDTAEGGRYELVKNYPSDSLLRKKLADKVREIRIERARYFWLLSCRLK